MKRKHFLHALTFVIILLLAAGSYLLFCPHHTQSARHVVVLFSDVPRRYTAGDYETLLRKSFRKAGIRRVKFSFAYLCCEQWDEEHEIAEAQRLVDEATRKHPADLVVLMGDQATYSGLSTESEWTYKVPIVMGGVQFPNKGLLAKHPNVTGLSDSIDIPENLRMIKEFTGNWNTFINLDNIYLDRQIRKHINRQLEGNDSIINNLDWHTSTYDLVTHDYGKSSISSFCLRDIQTNRAWFEDKHTTNFIFVIRKFKDLIYIQTKCEGQYLQIVRFDNQNPMFTAIAQNFGRENSNILGGYFVAPATLTDDVASYAARLLNGEKPETLPIVPSQKTHWVDWQVAKRYGHSLSDIPDYCHLINLPWKEAHPLLYAFALSALALVVVGGLGVSTHLYLKERRQKQLALKQVERENALYSMSVLDNQSFAWERVGHTLTLSNSFWEFVGRKPRPIRIEEFAAMILPDSREDYLEGIRRVNQGETFTNEVQADFIGKGTPHWYKIRGKGMLDSKGQFERSYGMLTNVDDFKQREQELSEARKLAEEATLKESFLANMSHEIRTPLNAIVGFSSLLLDPDLDITDEEKLMYSETIQTNNTLLLKLINDILDLSRVESGAMDFDMKPWPVHTLIQKVYHTFQVQLPTHLTFRLHEPQEEGEATVRVDENRMQQVLGNLLTNAGKFTPEGSIELGWRYQGSQVELYVQDTGIGLSEEECKMVFSRFYKKDEFKQGTGLGLSICKAIVLRMGGRIKAQSVPGEGSRFSVFLPLMEG